MLAEKIKEVKGNNEPRGEDLYKTLIELLADQEGVEIEYTLEKCRE